MNSPLARDSDLYAILDLARWAPSGDNTQTWAFEIINTHQFVVHGHFIGQDSLYDRHGHASEMAIGILLETIKIAASQLGYAVQMHQRADVPENTPTFDVALIRDDALKADRLAACIQLRSVQRKALSTRPIPEHSKIQFQEDLPEGYDIFWIEGLKRRLATALLMFRNAGLRLTLPEAYLEHRKIIEWNARFSTDRIPDRALGIDPLLRKLMKWALQSWKRVNTLNRYAAGTWLPRIEMDLLPGIACGAHFVILAPEQPQTQSEHIQAGRAVQRFWLSACDQGLQLQPETTPLIFNSYLREAIPFSDEPFAEPAARKIQQQLAELIGQDNLQRAVFMGRLGFGQPASARSVRKPLEDLILNR